MIIILLLAPVLILMSMAVLAALLGWSLNNAVDAEYEGTEQLAIAYPDKP